MTTMNIKLLLCACLCLTACLDSQPKTKSDIINDWLADYSLDYKDKKLCSPEPRLFKMYTGSYFKDYGHIRFGHYESYNANTITPLIAITFKERIVSVTYHPELQAVCTDAKQAFKDAYDAMSPDGIGDDELAKLKELHQAQSKVIAQKIISITTSIDKSFRAQHDLNHQKSDMGLDVNFN